jgi:hypothetical protein
MMLMAIDHIREFVAPSSIQFLPTDLIRTSPPFLTRSITHFCPPVSCSRLDWARSSG